jgi:hypothetical protein
LETALLPWSFEDEITSKGTALRSNNGFARSNTAAIAPADSPSLWPQFGAISNCFNFEKTLGSVVRVNHDVNTDDDASYDSDDSSLSSSDDSLRSGTPSTDLDNRDVDELNYGIDDDDDLMEPASEPVCFRACVRACL